MIPNKLDIKCAKCGEPAVLEVVPDGFDDAPESFTIRRTCSGPCEKTYGPQLTAKEMNQETGLPLTGWSKP